MSRAPGRPVAEGGVGQVVATGSAGGSIYDLGYRGYEGPRLGRRHAIASLVRESFRQSFGLGRPGRAKIIPMGLAVMAILPAVVALGVAALAAQVGGSGQVGQASPVRYDNYYPLIAQTVALFAAAQAPELLGRDLRHRVLALYFARSFRREDYALAKFAGIGLAMLIFTLVPQVLVFIGRVFVAADIPAAVSNEVPSLAPVVAQAVLTAALLGSLSLAVAAFTPRRAFATAAIIAVLIVPPVVVAVAVQIAGSDIAGPLTLLSPPNLLEGSNAYFFGLPMTGPLDVGLPDLAYPLASIVIAAAAMGVLVWRYRSLEP